jgi:hypothetical protein
MCSHSVLGSAGALPGIEGAIRINLALEAIQGCSAGGGGPLSAVDCAGP